MTLYWSSVRVRNGGWNFFSIFFSIEQLWPYIQKVYCHNSQNIGGILQRPVVVGGTNRQMPI